MRRAQTVIGATDREPTPTHATSGRVAVERLDMLDRSLEMWITSCMCRMTHVGSKRAGFASDSARPRRPESVPRVDVSRVPPSIRPRVAQGQVPSATFTFRTPGSAPVWREAVARPEGFEHTPPTFVIEGVEPLVEVLRAA